MLLAVNYHYVGMQDYPFPGIHGLTAEEFLSQILWLRDHFQLIGLPELVAAVNGMKLPSKACILTFDDGLRCHYDVVMPLMEKYEFLAVFFIASMPLENKRATNVHKNQFVRANVPIEKIYNLALREAHQLGLELDTITKEQVRRHYRYDRLDIARIKYLLNYLLPEKTSRRIIDHFFYRLVHDETAFCNEWYISEKQIRDLHQRFGCIGSHAHSHEPLAVLEDIDADMEITTSKCYLETVTGLHVNALSYPLGNPMAVSRREADMAAMAGYQFAFTMEREVNLTLEHPFLLARIDCNDLPYVGKSPLFQMNNGQLVRLDGQKSRRRHYFEEL